MTMTWEQFKEHVDKYLRDSNLGADIDILYFDVSFPDEDMNIRIEKDGDSLIITD